MTNRGLIAAAIIVGAAIVAAAFLPRFSYHDLNVASAIGVDRWTGELWLTQDAGATWLPVADDYRSRPAPTPDVFDRAVAEERERRGQPSIYDRIANETATASTPDR